MSQLVPSGHELGLGLTQQQHFAEVSSDPPEQEKHMGDFKGAPRRRRRNPSASGEGGAGESSPRSWRDPEGDDVGEGEDLERPRAREGAGSKGGGARRTPSWRRDGEPVGRRTKTFTIPQLVFGAGCVFMLGGACTLGGLYLLIRTELNRQLEAQAGPRPSPSLTREERIEELWKELLEFDLRTGALNPDLLGVEEAQGPLVIRYRREAEALLPIMDRAASMRLEFLEHGLARGATAEEAEEAFKQTLASFVSDSAFRAPGLNDSLTTATLRAHVQLTFDARLSFVRGRAGR